MQRLIDASGVLSILLCLLAPGLDSCNTEPMDASGSVEYGDRTAIVLPPGHPGVVNGSTLVIPAAATPPAVHYANCFAGVPETGDAGVGAGAGYDFDFINSAILPVNVNLGNTVSLGSYKIQIEVADASVELLTASVDGSYPWLSTANCQDRCVSICAKNPTWYPQEFDPAPGFETPPTVTPFAGGIVIEAADAAPGNPTTGRVNLANVPFRVVSALPAGGVDVTFTALSIKDSGGTDVTISRVFHGVIISAFKVE